MLHRITRNVPLAQSEAQAIDSDVSDTKMSMLRRPFRGLTIRCGLGYSRAIDSIPLFEERQETPTLYAIATHAK
jgi:hypothetical protein